MNLGLNAYGQNTVTACKQATGHLGQEVFRFNWIVKYLELLKEIFCELS